MDKIKLIPYCLKTKPFHGKYNGIGVVIVYSIIEIWKEGKDIDIVNTHTLTTIWEK